MEYTNLSSPSSTIVNEPIWDVSFYQNPSTYISKRIRRGHDGLPRNPLLNGSTRENTIQPDKEVKTRFTFLPNKRIREESVDLDIPSKGMVVWPGIRKDGKIFRKGPKILSSDEVERLVKLGDKIERARFERKKKREKLKSTCKKLQEDVLKFVNDKLADDVHSLSFFLDTSLQKEFQDMGLDITKRHTQDEGEIFSVKLEFRFSVQN
ncbi:hypothetical protein BELL_1165g00020 [Botrytis elliptica]|uniref:Uncharacterized protein n=1 Tax=Botrytis elliptica TaxID=278938 RepID=A0A4Z1IXQ5_9HELO|nr:hypothetical protein BELL_1165g00020 [Botrytis elliptica]